MERSAVLVVDDDPENLEALSTLLASPYSVRVSRYGENATRIAAETPQPDLVFPDVMTPRTVFSIRFHLKNAKVVTDDT
jgi:CheY-like chemotaxis protein